MGNKYNEKKGSATLVRKGDEAVIKDVCKTIMDEKISSSEELRKRYEENPLVNAAILRNAKVVAATITLVKTTGKTDITKTSFFR